LLLASVPLCLAADIGAATWAPVNPAELALRSPGIEPDADAEALLWDVRVAHRVDHGTVRTELSNYIRIKVFSQHGRDRLGTVEIPYGGTQRISDIAGRTIRPDGGILELDTGTVHDRTLVKAGGTQVRAKSFAMPGLDVGSIIEY